LSTNSSGCPTCWPGPPSARQAWLRPGATERDVHLSGGPTPAEEYCWEMTVDLAGTLLRSVEPRVAGWQGPSFAPPVPVPPDTDAQTRLIALLGRRPVG
jgi:hypothetical protein